MKKADGFHRLVDTDRRRITLAAAGFAALGAHGWSRAQTNTDYPNRPVRLVVPFAAGGGSDQIMRLIAQRASPHLGQNIIIDNRAGAGGLVGTEQVASSPPDGYTLLANGTPLGMYHLMAGSKGFDPGSIEPLSMLYLTPNVICVPSSAAIDSLDGLVKQAREHGGTMNFGSPGIGTLGHLCGEMFNIRFGTKIQHIPFRGTALLLTELLSGRIDFTLDNALPYLPHIEAGKVRPLAAISAKRIDLLPEVPTLAELGVEDFDIESWAALWGPKGLQPAVAAKINTAFTQALQEPETSQALAKLAARPYAASPGETDAYRVAMTEKYTGIITTAGIKLD